MRSWGNPATECSYRRPRSWMTPQSPLAWRSLRLSGASTSPSMIKYWILMYCTLVGIVRTPECSIQYLQGSITCVGSRPDLLSPLLTDCPGEWLPPGSREGKGGPFSPKRQPWASLRVPSLPRHSRRLPFRQSVLSGKLWQGNKVLGHQLFTGRWASQPQQSSSRAHGSESPEAGAA